MAELQLTLLGGVGISQNGAPIVDLHTRKALALLCYLVVNRQPSSREALAGLLWGEMPEDSARMNLRRTLSRLRPFIGPHLHITRREVGFNRELPYWLDVEAFETAVSPPKSRVTQLDKAINLYQGDFLDGFHVKNAPAFEAWTLAQRVRLRDMAVQTMQTLVANCLQQTAFSEGIAYANRLLALDPWREEAHRRLMELLARDGQRSAALMQYDACRRILSEELGVDPAPATMAVYEQILHNSFDTAVLLPTEKSIVDRETAVELSPGEGRIPHNLIRPLLPFLGRENELAILEQLLTDPTARAITIFGPGGMGKTRLALGIAEIQLSRQHDRQLFPHGVYFVHLAKIDSADGILPAIAEAIHLNFHEYGQPQQQLLNHLRSRKMLLILDNFEHVLAGVTLVEEMLRTSPGTKIIVTSREKLNRQWEYLFPLIGMDFPDEGSGRGNGDAARFGAIKLFLKTAQRARPAFQPTSEDMKHVVRICRLVQGMPLGIILAAGWLEILLPREIAAEIKRGLDFLETEMYDIPQRQRSLRAAFAYSWRRLAEAERLIFQQLSVFRGGFTFESAQAVTGATLHDLKALMGKSLLQRDSAGRYEIHELLRQFAAEQLANVSEMETAVRNRHSVYFCRTMEEWAPDLKGPQQKGILDKIDVEFNNALMAWKWAVRQKNIAWLSQVLDGLLLFCDWRYRHQELVNICQKTIAALEDSTSAAGLKLLIKLQNWHSLFTADGEESHRLLQKSLDLLDHPALADVDTRLEKAKTLQMLGSDIDPALGYYASTAGGPTMIEKSVDIFLALDDKWNAADALLELGVMATFQADFQTAASALEKSLVMAEVLGDPRLIAHCFELIVNLATFVTPPEEMGSVEQMARRCMEIRRDLGQGFFYPTGMIQTTFTLCAQGKYEAILEPINQGLAILEELGQVNTVFSPIMATMIVHLGDYQRARQLTETTLSIAQDLFVTGWAAAASGHVNLAEGDKLTAQDWYTQSVTNFQQIGQADEIWFLPDWALAMRSREALLKSIKKITETSAKGILYRVPPVAAIYLAEQGDIERAVEMYALAERYPAIANSLWYEDVVGREIAALATSLPRDVVEAARKRGRALDLWETAVSLLTELSEPD